MTEQYFNVCTNTLFDNTKIELQKWFLDIIQEISKKRYF